jgi:hypothetical protein
MPVQRHLVRSGSLGDRVDTDAPKSAAMEEVPRCCEYSRTGRRHAKFIGHMLPPADVPHDPLDRHVTGR